MASTWGVNGGSDGRNPSHGSSVAPDTVPEPSPCVSWSAAGQRARLCSPGADANGAGGLPTQAVHAIAGVPEAALRDRPEIAAAVSHRDPLRDSAGWLLELLIRRRSGLVLRYAGDEQCRLKGDRRAIRGLVASTTAPWLPGEQNAWAPPR